MSTLPFSDSIDGTGATLEASEPNASCGGNPRQGTAWYKFTASETASLSANGAYFNTMAVYTGSGLGNLTEIGCRDWSGLFTFQAQAGTTYYFQLAGFSGSTSLAFQLVKTPPPNAGFVYYPGDPSSFDTIQFYDQSSDPGQLGIQSWSWSFGDGGTSTSQSATHRYLADGDYTVKLSVTTQDGRTGSTQQIVHVRTHDVAIAKLSVPQSANVGQTRSIVIGISNKRYPETAQVQLFKSNPSAYGGFDLVGTLQLNVPVRSGVGRPTSTSRTPSRARTSRSAR